MPETKPKLTILRPRNNDTIHLNQPFPVTGQVTNQFVSGGDLVVRITSVTVQVDAGPVRQAALTPVQDKTQTKVNFAANAQVTGGQDPHTITVTATNDRGGSATQTVSVFAGSVVSFPFPYPTSLRVWGRNTEGELGNHANADIDHPTLNDVFFPAGTQLTGLAAGVGAIDGGSHSLAVARNGNLFAWGHDSFGQVGDGRGFTDVFGPVQPCAAGQTAPCTEFLGTIIATAAGGVHSLALDTFDNVWAWGNNDSAQLGVNLGGGISFSAIPIRNDALLAQVNQHGRPPIRAIAAGNNHSLARDSGSFVWAWGDNRLGQLGLGTNETSVTFASPILFLQEKEIRAIAAGGNQSFALDSEGNVWAWGANDRGQLGISSFDPQRNTPVKLEHFPPNTRITRIAAGAFHTLAIDGGGSLWAWGANDNGKLGNGTKFDSHGPARVSFPTGTPGIVMIAAGGAHSLAVDANGNLWAWGANGRGQLGIGKEMGIESIVPARAIYTDGATHPIVSIAAGEQHSLALESQSFLFGLETVLDLEPLKFQVLLLPQSLTHDAITVTTTSSTIDAAGHKLLVTNTLTDTAGNKLVLTFIQQREDHKSLVLEVKSVQYNDGVVMTPPRNRIEYQWNTDAGATVTSLKQHLELGQGSSKTEITANYNKTKNQTAIDLVLRSGPAKLTAPGLVTLRTSTISGGLSFSDGIRTWSQ
jgi:alpha-tubulin suppressor-like RCC1 family protein